MDFVCIYGVTKLQHGKLISLEEPLHRIHLQLSYTVT